MSSFAIGTIVLLRVKEGLHRGSTRCSVVWPKLFSKG